MSGFRVFILIMQVGTGLLLIGLCVPLIRRKIAPNPWYGFRVRQTLDDPKIWYEANAYAGKTLMAAGIVMVVGSLVLYAIPALDGPAFATACAVLALAAILASVIQSFRFLGRLTSPTDA